MIKTRYGIIDRTKSSRFLSLDGVWKIKRHENVEKVELGEELTQFIPVPACVQMHGFDKIQYINARYPFPVLFPKMQYDNPCWHYRRAFTLAKKTGELTSLTVDGVEILRTPLHVNFTRYIDNDRPCLWQWDTVCNHRGSKSYALSMEKLENGYAFRCAVASNTREPILFYDVAYKVEKGALVIETEYECAEYAGVTPRFGFEFAVDKKYAEFSYVGFGPYESYSDRKVSCEYGYYESNAEDNYEKNYVRPQESGSHYATRYVNVKDLLTVTAENAFSFSVNPYTTEQLRDTLHAYELKKNDFVNICLDVAMRGVGSMACVPQLDAKYEIPKKAKNIFKINF